MTYFEKKANLNLGIYCRSYKRSYSGPFFAFRRTDVICELKRAGEGGNFSTPCPKLIALRAKKRLRFHLSCQLRFAVNLIWPQLLCAYFGHLTHLWHTVLKRCIFSFCKQVLPAFIKVSKSSRLIVHCNMKRSQTISDKAQLLTLHLSGRGSPTPYIQTQMQ